MADFKDYKRVTNTDDKQDRFCFYDCCVASCDECVVEQMKDRLTKLEDMIEQGKLVEKTEMRRFVEDVEKLLCDYLYENVNGENVMLVAPYLELMPKAKEITKKYGVEE